MHDPSQAHPESIIAIPLSGPHKPGTHKPHAIIDGMLVSEGPCLDAKSINIAM